MYAKKTFANSFNMYQHHQETINNVITSFKQDPHVLALVLGGSIAHGYAKPSSDVDIVIVVTNEEYLKRKKEHRLIYYNKELCTYPDGYVDGHYIDENYLTLVEGRGNEPTRYAFKDCQILFSNSDNITQLILNIGQFNQATKERNALRFYAQLQAWKWYFYEGKKHENPLLVSTAINNFILFASRVILNHNEMLYPYHKWLLHEVEKAPKKPEQLTHLFKRLLKTHKKKYIEEITAEIKKMRDWQLNDWDWPSYFMEDVETTWLTHEAYIADI